MALIRKLSGNLPSILGITQNETHNTSHKMDACSQTRKGASSQESLDDKNDICLRGLFKIPPLAPRPAGGTHTFSAAILPMPVSPPCCMQQNATTGILHNTTIYFASDMQDTLRYWMFFPL
jgi:hypothetical protein